MKMKNKQNIYVNGVLRMLNHNELKSKTWKVKTFKPDVIDMLSCTNLTDDEIVKLNLSDKSFNKLTILLGNKIGNTVVDFVLTMLKEEKLGEMKHCERILELSRKSRMRKIEKSELVELIKKCERPYLETSTTNK
jgi:hypothetical protein